MKKNGNQLKSVGLLAGIVSLLCLPCLLALILIGAGLISILAFLGNWLTPIVLALLSGGILNHSPYVVYNRQLSYVGSALLIAAVIADYLIRKRHKASYEECKVRQ